MTACSRSRSHKCSWNAVSVLQIPDTKSFFHVRIALSAALRRGVSHLCDEIYVLVQESKTRY
jgi:hypothetical protein